MRQMKKLKGQQELASLLGFTNFLQDQILLYSQVVGPLQQIASKKNWDKDMWGPEQEAAFSRLKTALLKVPVVHQPDMECINRRITAQGRSENKELGVLSKRERENNKRFLVTQRKPKLKTLGD